MREPPYLTELKPYGRALLDLARRRDDVLCLSGDLTRQCEIDLFQAEIPERFIHGGMAEANMMSMAGALARCGHIPFVHTFGVFATRRPFDQIANAIAYPNLPVRLIGFMPGVSSPGGPSHQAIDDVALMRALPNMTVVDVADAVEVRQVVDAIVDVPGPVYVRLKRGEIPVIFDDDHVLNLDRADVLLPGTALHPATDRDRMVRARPARPGPRRPGCCRQDRRVLTRLRRALHLIAEERPHVLPNQS
jgi:transketolase